MSITQRNGTFYLRRRVPRRYEGVAGLRRVNLSLHTDSLDTAQVKAKAAWGALIETWEARLAGDTTDAERAYEAARNICQARGFRYLPMDKVLELPVDQIAARVLATADRTGSPNLRDARALLGVIDKPKITVEKALDLYWTLAEDRTLEKSADQLRRWRNPRLKAIRNFIAVVGNIGLDEITADDMQDFHEWWLDRIKSGEVIPSSANKELTHIGDILNTVNKAKRLGLALPVSGWALKEGERKPRPSFSREWIETRLLAPGALDGLNPHARGCLLGMVNTGYRPSEGAQLRRDQIKLDANVPHISIEAVERQLKSKYARRKIPLLGVSLDAFREFPEGFTRYDGGPTVSATINKFLLENGLKETEGHTLYSLRHSFQDRMIAAGIDDRIRRDLFGHTLTEERYGEGASLAHKAAVMTPAAIHAPGF